MKEGSIPAGARKMTDEERTDHVANVIEALTKQVMQGNAYALLAQIVLPGFSYVSTPRGHQIQT
eukprot:763601-Hanusia_phi.AAC.6